MPGYRERPLNRKGDLTTGKPCLQCRAPFDLLHWTPNKWTLSGWSPWCPECHKAHSGQKEVKARRGPKPKNRMEMQTWTNLPS
jgi:hypothetical protein